MLQCPGSSWGFGALLKDTSVVVLRVERVLYIHSLHLQFLPAQDSNSQPFDCESDSLTIRPRLPPVNGVPELLRFPHSSEYLPLCSVEHRHSYRFGTTWGWVNDDRIFIFGWTIPLRSQASVRVVPDIAVAALHHHLLVVWGPADTVNHHLKCGPFRFCPYLLLCKYWSLFVLQSSVQCSSHFSFLRLALLWFDFII